MGVNMASIRLKNKGYPITHVLGMGDFTISYEQDCSVPTLVAVGFVGSEDYTVSFEQKDKEAIQNASETSIDILKTEFKVKGNKDKLIERMFPTPKVKKAVQVVKKAVEPIEPEIKPKVDKADPSSDE